jgi:pyruvate kinase
LSTSLIGGEVGKFKTSPRYRKATKQIATLGPASSTEEMVENLFLAGADIFRLNFSHGKHSDKAQLIDIIRKIERKYSHPIGVLADLQVLSSAFHECQPSTCLLVQGPKLRVGSFLKGKVHLKAGQMFCFDLQRDLPGDENRVCLPHPEILFTLQAGDQVLLDDGKLNMRVVKSTMHVHGDQTSGSSAGHVCCEVLTGGDLSNNKGVNTPSIVLPISPLTPKDKRLRCQRFNNDSLVIVFIIQGLGVHFEPGGGLGGSVLRSAP